MHFVTRCSALLLIATILLKVETIIDLTCQKLVNKKVFIRAFGSVGSSLVLLTSSGQIFTDIASTSFDEAKNKLKLAVVAKPLYDYNPSMEVLHQKLSVNLKFNNYDDHWFFFYRPNYGRARLGVVQRGRRERFVQVFKYDFQGHIDDLIGFFCNESDICCYKKLSHGFVLSSFKQTCAILVFDQTDTKMYLSWRFDDKGDNFTDDIELKNTAACRPALKSTITAMTATGKKLYIFEMDGTVTVHEMPIQDKQTDYSKTKIGEETRINIADFIKCVDTEDPSWDSLDYWLTPQGICIIALAIVIPVTIGCRVYNARKPKSAKKKTYKDENKRKSRISSAITQLGTTLSSAFSTKKVSKKKKKKQRIRKPHSSFVGISSVNSLPIGVHSFVVNQKQHREPQTKSVVKKKKKKLPAKSRASTTSVNVSRVMSLQNLVATNLEHYREQQVKPVTSSKTLSLIVKKTK